MKKTGFIILLLIMGTSGVLKAQSGNKEKQFVARFLSYMHAERGTNYPAMMNCISPAYLKENTINKNDHKVNNYTIWGFTIDSLDESNNIVYCRIYGQKHSWTYKLCFQLSKENDQLYIVPSSFDEQWIHPWCKEVE